MLRSFFFLFLTAIAVLDCTATIPVSAQTLFAGSKERVENEASFLLGATDIGGFGISVNAPPAGYMPVPRLVWGAGVEGLYKIDKAWFAGLDVTYSKRAWDMQRDDNPSIYDDLRVEYVTIDPFVRWKWASVGINVLLPCAVQATYSLGQSDQTISQFVHKDVQTELCAGASLHLTGTIEDELRGFCYLTYSLANVFDDWQIHSSPVASEPINGRLLTIQAGFTYMIGIYQ